MTLEIIVGMLVKVTSFIITIRIGTTYYFSNRK